MGRVGVLFQIFVVLCLGQSLAFGASQKINGMYVNTFGDPAKQALIFVHGGPGYNSWDFELTTAPELSKKGFYVVVYDERGQGRSDATDPETYSYKQYADDLKGLIDQLKLNRPVLLGHSHGGPISIKFEQFYPGVADKIVLISAPIRFESAMHAILNHCSEKYASSGDAQRVTELAYLDYELFSDHGINADTLSGVISYAFGHGMQCGLYQTKNPTPEAIALKDLLKANPIQGPLSGTTVAMPGFVKNENYIRLDLSDFVANNRTRFCGVYGAEDGLFTPLELSVIRNLLQQPNEPERVTVLRGASHALYVDQQQAFFQALQQTCQISPASNFPRVDADMKAYDDHVGVMNADFDKLSANPQQKEWVKAKLKHMFDVDQYMRNYSNTPFQHQYSEEEKQEFQRQFGSRWFALDSKNTADLKGLLKIYRWFTISDFGADADKQAWLLVQHADLDLAFQKEVLAILTDLYSKGETNPSNYAYLFDRVAASWNDPTQRTLQRYGTQGTCTGPGTWEPLPVEDPDRLDDRRKSVGLGPEDDYIKLFKDICH